MDERINKLAVLANAVMYDSKATRKYIDGAPHIKHSTLRSLYSKLAYFSWRILKGNIVGGLKPSIRRARGIYLEDCPLDNVEYHAMRGGVDQDAIYELFEQLGFECEIIRYFSTQSRIWQPIGTALGIKNTFAVVARKSSRCT